MSENISAHEQLPEKQDLYNFVYENELIRRIDEVHKTPCHFLWIDAAWRARAMPDPYS